jgi:hypothetical protein
MALLRAPVANGMPAKVKRSPFALATTKKLFDFLLKNALNERLGALPNTRLNVGKSYIRGVGGILTHAV